MLTNLLLNQTAADEPLYVEDVFSTYLYTGNGSTQTITNGINLASNGGLVWIKRRNSAISNVLADTTRGVSSVIYSDLANVADTTTTYYFSDFTSSGFTIKNVAETGANGGLYASWTFRKAAKFFDIVTWTGDGVSGRQISHNLGIAPGMIIVKCLSSASDWQVYHTSLGNNHHLVLNSSAAAETPSTRWNTTSPSSSIFTIGSDSRVNSSGATYVAYLFAHDTAVDGIVKCGSFTTDGNGIATVSLGWEPQFILYKASNSHIAWLIHDNTRGVANGGNTAYLSPTATDAESILTSCSLKPAGITLSGNANTTYVYMAIRRGPMRTPTDATKVFQPVVYTGTNVDNRLVDTTIAPDMVMVRQRSDTVLGGMIVGDRLRGNPYLRTGGTNAEVSDADSFMTPTASYGNSFSAMNGFGVGNDATSKLNANTTSNNHIAFAFKRAAGFFDISSYNGTASNTTISHNLGVVPELIIVKKTSTTSGWAIYVAPLGESKYILLNSTNDAVTSTTAWNNTSPTSSVFSLGTSTVTNGTGQYFAYLFASCPGVSKIGSYTGNGSSQNIDCGFTSGARFVLIRRTGTTDQWYVWDTARGIVAANDPYLVLNSTDAEVTTDDSIDPLNSGFTVNQNTTTNINVSSATYIYLAIA